MHDERGGVDRALAQVTYIGRIAHGTTSYAGLHPAILPAKLWEPVQAMLAENRHVHRTKGRAQSPSLLAGKLVDEHGAPLLASHASRGERRYRYYASKVRPPTRAVCVFQH